jgi:hypothetical protein
MGYTSKAEIAQRGVIIGPLAQRPEILAIAIFYPRIVDACVAHPHQSILVEFPILIAVAAVPLPGIVVPFVGKAHGNSVLTTAPDFLDQAVIKFSIPFAD